MLHYNDLFLVVEVNVRNVILKVIYCQIAIYIFALLVK